MFIFGRKSGNVASATLEFWGLDEPAAWSQIITAYQTQKPGVIVNYLQKDPLNYEKDLLNALASGSGPDIMVINNTWLNKHLPKLSVMDGALMSQNDFKQAFVDVASADLIRAGKIYALPFYVDTLALYYNKSFFNNAGLVNPPKTWEDFNIAVKALTIKDASGNILRSGIALGNANNVNYSTDILSLLMLQTGAIFISPDGTRAVFDQATQLNGQAFYPGEEALNFYTSFANSSKPVYTWNARMNNSLTSFLQNQSAMYLGYAKDLKSIEDSTINFAVSAVPQVKDSRSDPSYLDVNFASYFAGAVTQMSNQKTAAWDFLIFATSRNASYSYLTATRLPVARKDLIPNQASDVMLSVFAKQALTAFSWPQPDNAEVDRIFRKMIDAAALGQSSVKEAIKEGALEITNLLR